MTVADISFKLVGEDVYVSPKSANFIKLVIWGKEYEKVGETPDEVIYRLKD